MKQYTVLRARATPELDGAWDGPAWAAVPVVEVDHFHAEGQDHCPRTQAKMVHDDAGVYVIFQVQDQYVRCVETKRQGPVCRDSCVEFFVEPVPGRGYFNFEINCGGTLLLHYNAQPAGVHYAPKLLNGEDLDQVRIYHSMPRVVEPELHGPVTWRIEFFAPYELFEACAGPARPEAGTVWRGNFYKCGDETSHPHWGMWNPIPGPLGFHRTEYFAPLIFA